MIQWIRDHGQALLDWIGPHEVLLGWLGVASIVMFVGCLVALPYLVVRIPDDYFARRSRRLTKRQVEHPALRIILIALKDTIGVVFVLTGIAMLVLPGQGLLTILIGLTLMNFPGKFALERRIVKMRPVLRAINWMRRRANHPPLRLGAPLGGTRQTGSRS
jgi:hypothetical protein